MLGRLRPQLESFRLVAANIETTDGPRSKKRPWTFSVSNEVQIGFSFAKAEDQPIRAVLKDHFKLGGKPADGGIGSADLDVKYQVAFIISTEVKQAEIDSAMRDDDELQYVLISQAHALSLAHLRGLIQDCGFDSSVLSFNF